jgi:hypothetical protein
MRHSGEPARGCHVSVPSERPSLTYGFTVSTAVFETTSVAVIVGFVTAVTAFVVTVNVAALVPGWTVTLAGTTAAALLDESWTTSPPAPAFAVSVTVPVRLVPPFTEVAESLSDESRIGRFESAAEWSPVDPTHSPVV